MMLKKKVGTKDSLRFLTHSKITVKLSKTKIAFAFCLSFLVGAPFVYGAQIKNLTDIRGARSNQLFGYGIVTGLALSLIHI